MSSPTTITMIAPDGSTADVPLSGLEGAKQAGAKVAVQMRAPKGDLAWVPADQVHTAAVAGAKMVPMNVPDAAKASYWDALTNPVGSGGQEQGVLGAVKQVGGQAIKAMAQPVVHPLDTLSGLYNTVRHPIDTATGMVNQVKSDYAQGGVPLAAENLTGQALGAVESGRIAAPVAQAAMNAAPAVVGRAVLLGKTPEAAYESAMKPSTTISQADRTAMVKTGLDNAIPVSKAGVEKIGDLIDDYNQKIKAQIASDPNRPIDPQAVATRADLAKAKFSQQVNAQPDLNAIEDSKQQFLAEQGATPVSVSGANGQPLKFYRGIQQPLNKTTVGSGHFTTNPDLASNYAMGSKGTVVNGYLNIKNPMPWTKAQFLTPQEIKAAGYDGAYEPLVKGKSTRAIVTDPSQLTSTPQISVPPMGAADAQAMKQGTYRVLAGKYGEQGSATVEAQKALALGLKEEIAAQFPEVSDFNAAESKLLNLQPVLERAVNRISNHQIIGIGTPVAGAAATAVTGSTGIGKVAMVMKAVLDNPQVKSRLAIAVSKGGKIPYSQALARVQSYAMSLGSVSSVGQENSSGDTPNPPATPQP